MKTLIVLLKNTKDAAHHKSVSFHNVFSRRKRHVITLLIEVHSWADIMLPFFLQLLTHNELEATRIHLCQSALFLLMHSFVTNVASIALHSCNAFHNYSVSADLRPLKYKFEKCRPTTSKEQCAQMFGRLSLYTLASHKQSIYYLCGDFQANTVRY